MKIVQINLTYGIGSTGKIMKDLNTIINSSGHSGYMVSGYTSEDNVENLFSFTKSKDYYFSIRKDILISRITGEMGYRNENKTKDLINWLKNIKPDLIHLHNIHGDWINIPILFKYIKEEELPVVWTLHDCWSFTGRCSHFEMYGCDEWKTGCKRKCKNKVYPLTYFFDKTTKMWIDKKEWFTGIKNLTLVTPSKWLSNYVSQSFLKQYECIVINNGIDTALFSYNSTKSKYLENLENKKIVLGVASSWTKWKGLNDFIEISNLLDSRYQIVLVGLNANQLKSLPTNIIGIGRTQNQKELVELYSNADVFVNPTYQDNYPTTNLEAISCGLPIITYNTGGSPESILCNYGSVVPKGDIKVLIEEIKKIINLNYDKTIISKLGNEKFDKYLLFSKYIEVYEKVIRED